jgi:choline kinase
MSKGILIQANGNNIRLGKYFKQPKYELYYKNTRIIESIINNSLLVTKNVYVAIRKNSRINFNTKNIKLIYCDQTTTRLETLKQCFPYLKNYKSIIIHDCDTIIESNVLKNLKNNSIAITNYKLDGLKYGFINLDNNFKYLNGNEKTFETGHITIGAYCVDVKEYNNYLKWATKESMLDYYNQCNQTNVVYSKNHTNLGDINSYMENLWLQ